MGSAAGDARAFIETAERRLQDLSIRVDRADWVQQNFITTDTEEMAAHAKEDLIAAVMEYARQARRFERLKLPDDVARKLALLKQSVELPAPTDPSERGSKPARHLPGPSITIAWACPSEWWPAGSSWTAGSARAISPADG